MMKYLSIASLCLALVFPVVVLAQGTTAPTFGNTNYATPRFDVTAPTFGGYPAPLDSTPITGGSPTTVNQNTSAYSGCYSNMDNIGDLLCRIAELINSIIPILIALGVLYMVWGIVQYVIADSEEAKGTGKDRIIYGIIGLTVIVGLWGLVALTVNTFGLAANAPKIDVGSFLVNGTDTTPGGFCTLGSNPKLQNLLGYGTCLIVKSVIPLIFVLAIAAFVWGIVQFFILGAGEEAKREQGRQFMLWGIIALTVMICVWGLVAIVGGTFNIENTIPQVKSH